MNTKAEIGPETKILKIDALGRVKTPRDHREAVLDAFEKSGIPGTRFARQHGIKYQTFASWVQKRRRERGDCKAPVRGKRIKESVSLTEIVVEGASESKGLRVELPGGTILVVNDASQAKIAAELLRHLSPAVSKC